MNDARTRQRPLLRLAARVVERLSPRSDDDPIAAVTQMHRIADEKARLLQRASANGWAGAVGDLRIELTDRLERLVASAKSTIESLRRRPAPPPRLSDVFAELRQLESEFDDFAIDLKLRTVSAVIGPVVLEGVRLGRFRLTLDVGKLEPDSHDGCFLVDALEPNPAAGERNITHPHVSDGRVCAGEAEIPLVAALRQGRLFDAFALLRAVLNHYAPDSPYVSLDTWGGVNCPECGKSGPADELTSCMSCRREVCNDCSSYCRCCDTTRCDDCLEPCEVCRLQCCGGCLEELDERHVCEHCRKACKECGEPFATDRLDRATGVCKGCRLSAADEAA